MKITINVLWNFHNRGPINIFLKNPEKTRFGNIPISPYQAKRLNYHFCGIKACCCGSSPVFEEYPGGKNIVISPLVIIEKNQ